MKIGIICALDVEAAPIIARCEQKRASALRGFSYCKGHFQGVEWIVMTSSVGKVNAALATQLLILEESPDLIVNVGVAGGLGSELSLHDVVVATELVHHDVSRRQQETFYPFQSVYPTDRVFLEKIRKKVRDARYGRVVSGEGFIRRLEDRMQIMSRFDPLCVEMEGAAVAQTAYIHGIPFLSIRAISDFADERAQETYENNEGPAAERAARALFRCIESIAE